MDPPGKRFGAPPIAPPGKAEPPKPGPRGVVGENDFPPEWGKIWGNPKGAFWENPNPLLPKGDWGKIGEDMPGERNLGPPKKKTIFGEIPR